MAKRGRSPAESPFRIGQRLAVRFPGGLVPVMVVEDRGRIGARGRHILRVRTLDESEENRDTFEVATENVVLE